jgi:L-amino acid N-acyltransferase YncA
VVTVEPAGPEHVAAITRLYAAEALDGYATFDVEGLPESVWEERRRSTGPGDALLVALGDGGSVLGFGWSHPYRPKPAYGSTRETTVYVDPAAAGAGVGTALYERLLEQATAAGVHVVVAGVAEPNPASTRLHERLGFTRVGTMTEVGYKHGRYRDVTWWQRRLG